MEETQEGSISMPIRMVSLKNPVKLISQRIPTNSVVLTSRSVKTVLLLPEPKSEIRGTVGLSQNTPFGKFHNMEHFQVRIE